MARPPAFARLGAAVARHRWTVLIGYLVAMVVFGVFGVQVFGAMKSEGFNYPGSDSSRAAVVLEQDFGVRDPAAILAIETPSDVETDAAAAVDLLAQVEAIEGVESVISYWSTGGAPELLGNDGRTGRAIVVAEEGTDLEQLSADVVSQVAGQQGELVVYAFGGEIIGNAFNDTITGDLARAESIAIPVTAIILLFVFGSVVAAGLPSRTPEVTIGFSGSKGMPFLLQVRWARFRPPSATFPVSPFGRRSTSTRWLSVPPVTRSSPCAFSSSARARAFSTTCFA